MRDTYQNNSLFLQLVTLPLNASMFYEDKDDGDALPIYGMCVRGHHLDVYTSPFVPSIADASDDVSPFDVSCAISAVIDERLINDIRVIMPDNSTRKSDGNLTYDDQHVSVTLS